MTVAEELQNRHRCRYKLKGVLVAADGNGAGLPVCHTYWDAASHLIVVLENGDRLPAERCHLRSKWPVACCPPRKHNEWNSTGRRWHEGPWLA